MHRPQAKGELDSRDVLLVLACASLVPSQNAVICDLGTRLLSACAHNLPLCTEKQARASKHINPMMPYAAMYTVRSLCLFLVSEDETGMCVLIRVSNLCYICLET